METHVIGAINTVGKVKSKIRLILVFRECIVSLPKTDQKSFICPSDKVVPLEAGLPRINLINVETSQIKYLVFKLQIIHRSGTKKKKHRLVIYFCFAAKIVHFRNVSKFVPQK
jgi:hypothetical protein